MKPFLLLDVLLVPLLFSANLSAQQEIDSAELQQAVETRLLYDEGVAAHAIDVEVTDGTVVLTGYVESAAMKERAASLVSTTRGVKQVQNELEVRPVERDDSQIAEDAKRALDVFAATEEYDLTVHVRDAVVQLNGFVELRQEKIAAERIVNAVPGVKRVINNIKIEGADVQDLDDDEIAERIRDRMAADALVNETMIQVKVEDRVVTLSGTVASAAEKGRAIQDAWAAGVREVNAEDLSVAWQKTPPLTRTRPARMINDQSLERVIRNELRADPIVVPLNLRVDVKRGRVVLGGSVNSYDAKRRAGRLIREIYGVAGVRNLLKVRVLAETPDEALAMRVQDAVRRNVYAAPYDVGISVSNGRIYLSGEVDSEFVKEQVEAVAAGVAGVLDIENRITVAQKPRKDDEELTNDVQFQIEWDPYLEGSDISVSVADGVVTLVGNVETWYEKRRAVANARVAGAERVRDHLKVLGVEPLKEKIRP